MQMNVNTKLTLSSVLTGLLMQVNAASVTLSINRFTFFVMKFLLQLRNDVLTLNLCNPYLLMPIIENLSG